MIAVPIKLKITIPVSACMLTSTIKIDACNSPAYHTNDNDQTEYD